MTTETFKSNSKTFVWYRGVFWTCENSQIWESVGSVQRKWGPDGQNFSLCCHTVHLLWSLQAYNWKFDGSTSLFKICIWLCSRHYCCATHLSTWHNSGKTRLPNNWWAQILWNHTYRYHHVQRGNSSITSSVMTLCLWHVNRKVGAELYTVVSHPQFLAWYHMQDCHFTASRDSNIVAWSTSLSGHVSLVQSILVC